MTNEEEELRHKLRIAESDLMLAVAWRKKVVADRTAAQAELRAAVDALRQVQWGNDELVSIEGKYSYVHLCPLCDQTDKRGHSPDCHVGAAIENYNAKHPEGE